MNSRSRTRRLGATLVITAIALVALSFGGGWALAPETTTEPADGETNGTATLVGVQGPARGGNVTLFDGPREVRWTFSDDAISYQDVSSLDPDEISRLERQGVATNLSNETVLATYAADGYDNCGPYDPPCKLTGIRLIDPVPEPHIAYEWSYPIRTRKDSEVHDAELLPSGELLVADMEYESVFTVDLATEEQTWVWNASEYYDPPPDPTRVDWLHINDVDYIAPGRYLVSVRNENQLLVVERDRGVVEVVNENGDPAVLYEQHNPHWLGDGAVLVADSENHRVVELHRNGTTGTWEVVWVVTRPGGILLDWPRDADRLPDGNTLITDSRNNRVVEVDQNGSLVASYATAPLPYEADRIPVAESVGRVHEGEAEAEASPPARRTIPILSTLLAGARHTVALPHWVSELHVLVTLVSAVLASLGVGLLVTVR